MGYWGKPVKVFRTFGRPILNMNLNRMRTVITVADLLAVPFE